MKKNDMIFKQRSDQGYILDYAFLVCAFLLACCPFCIREIAYAIRMTITPIILLLLFFGCRQSRPYQATHWLVVIYIIISVITILRGFWADSYPWQNGEQMLLALCDKTYVGLLLPVVAFFYFRTFNKLIYFSLIAAAIFWILVVFHHQLLFNPGLAWEEYSEVSYIFAGVRGMAWIAMLALFFPHRLNKKKYLFLLVTLLTCACLAAILGRRGTTVFLLLVILLLCLRGNFSQKLCTITILLFLLVSLAFLIGDDLWIIMEQRGFELNNRDQIVEEQMMQTSRFELFFGKGIYGCYLASDFVWNPITKQYEDLWRYMSEFGVMDIILRSGIIGLVAHILALGGAAVRGIFFSKNQIARAMGICIFFSLIELIPYGLQFFDFYHIIIWIFASYLYSKDFRALNDTEIDALIENNQI